MGKIRVKTIGDEEAEKEQQLKQQKRKVAKKLESVKTSDEKIEVTKDTDTFDEGGKTQPVEEKVEEPKASSYQEKQSKNSNNKQKNNTHSTEYQNASLLIDQNKNYSISDALSLLEKTHLGKFDETVELHINTKENGVSGSVVLPFGTGKKIRVATASEQLIKDVQSGKIDFDILLAEPAMMPQLAKVAKILGPKGLMPNPKNGTITTKPEEVAKKYEAGQINFKTEAKAPIIHLIIGKLSFKPQQLMDNYKTIINSIGPTKINKITLKSTMSPAIKVAI